MSFVPERAQANSVSASIRPYDSIRSAISPSVPASLEVSSAELEPARTNMRSIRKQERVLNCCAKRRRILLNTDDTGLTFAGSPGETWKGFPQFAARPGQAPGNHGGWNCPNQRFRDGYQHAVCRQRLRHGHGNIHTVQISCLRVRVSESGRTAAEKYIRIINSGLIIRRGFFTGSCAKPSWRQSDIWHGDKSAITAPSRTYLRVRRPLVRLDQQGPNHTSFHCVSDRDHRTQAACAEKNPLSSEPGRYAQRGQAA